MKVKCAAVIFGVGFVTAACSDKPSGDQQNITSAEASSPSGKVASAESEHLNATEGGSSRSAEREAAEGENELQPHEDEIAEDCVAFLRATKVVSATPPSGDCPTCPPAGGEVLRFQEMKIERISCTATTCEVAVSISALFNPAADGAISGGLTAWIPAEQRAEYQRGEIPPGPQAYPVKITYKRDANGWRALEFDRIDAR